MKTQIFFREPRFDVGEKKEVTGSQIERVRWMRQQFIAQFMQYDCEDSGCMNWCVVAVKKHFVFGQIGTVFLSISHRIGPIIHCSTAPWSCVLSPKSPWGLFPSNSKIRSHYLVSRWDRLSLLRSRFTWKNLFFWLLLSLWSTVMDLGFISDDDSMQKLMRISPKEVQTLL